MADPAGTERRNPRAVYALILAGGASSRFWPASGDEHPKYLLRVGEYTLLELAWQRALATTDAERVYLVTGAMQAHLFPEALPGLPRANLVIEPARRDTAAAIALGVRRIAAIDPEAWVMVLPADQLIEPVDALAAGVKRARAAQDAREHIHVFGIQPARPEGGFGYIQPGPQVAPGVRAVSSFREKPGADADSMVQQGWLWNAGCFLFNVPAFEAELQRHMPAHSARLAGTGVSESDYEGLESVSIDYGLIEKAQNLRVVELAAEFDDIGTWDALFKRLPQQGSEVQTVGGANNRGFGAEIVVVGESNLYVVVSDGKVLVLKQGHGHEVKKAGTPRQ
ncbi:MAG: NTP transferase domain-containing protein [Planctomycetes bacterium]|nr:NTP transferase domain-containing protein [Planctomycetota bacterium]MCW8136511.1 NTP transferase domain-containing protein [Planctomycetota bacterium]